MNFIVKLACCTIVTIFWLVTPVLAKQLSLSERVKVCSELTSDQARLSCFDQLTTKSSQVTKSVPQSVQQPTQLSAQQVDAFAKEQVKLSKTEQAKELTSISATIDKLTKTVHGQWKITFANGQKWLQKGNTRLSLKVGQRVVITKGALGAIYLKKDNSNTRIKVKRLK